MSNDASKAELKQIKPDFIDRNPENPRIIFRPAEFEDLLESIRLRGIQQPISVFVKGKRYVLIDGERRWRCSLKLNSPSIPALVQPEPSPLENLLMMFNIHWLREQWDLLTIALKLPRIIALLTEQLGYEPNVKQLHEHTGLNQAMIRRCQLLMGLPKKYRDEILRELHKPKSQQRVTEELFVEMERALRVVEKKMPEVIPNRDTVRRVLLKKYKEKTIDNKVHFRQIAKIARAEKVGGDVSTARHELERLFQNNRYSIEQAYLNSVGEAYKERDLGTRVVTLLTLLEEIDPAEIEPDLKNKLSELFSCLDKILEGGA
jgi:ParB/RepB/Spo0J family partition protein